jgi:uncharacterized protein
MKILLDTNFILSCIRNKLDFFEELSSEGHEIIVPENVIKEIKNFKSKKSEAELALIILEKYKNKFQKPELKGKNVDNSIINYAKENPEIIIATLDKGIHDKTKNKKMIIRNRKKFEII